MIDFTDKYLKIILIKGPFKNAAAMLAEKVQTINFLKIINGHVWASNF